MRMDDDEYLVVGLSITGIPPVNRGVSRAVRKHEPERVSGLGRVGATAEGRVGGLAVGQVAAEIAGAVAGGVALLGEALAEGGPGAHEDALGAAVEEQVVVGAGEGEARAGVQAEGARVGAEAGPVRAGPRGGVQDHEVGPAAVGVGDGADGVPAGRGAEVEGAAAGGRAREEVAVVRAAAPVVDAERVRDPDLAARRSA